MLDFIFAVFILSKVKFILQIFSLNENKIENLKMCIINVSKWTLFSSYIKNIYKFKDIDIGSTTLV